MKPRKWYCICAGCRDWQDCPHRMDDTFCRQYRQQSKKVTVNLKPQCFVLGEKENATASSF